MPATMAESPIEDVLRSHGARLLEIPGVLGAAGGETGGRPCVKVLVEQATPELLEALPPAIEGYPVEIEETGPIEALDPEARAARPAQPDGDVPRPQA